MQQKPSISLGDKFLGYIHLMRLNSYSGAFLAFFPCLFALINNAALDVSNFLMFLSLAFFGRSFGCVVNDIWDANIDKLVSRTRNRPIPSGILTRKEAIQFAVFLGVIGLWIISAFNWQVRIASLICGAMFMIYPILKRFTYFPQVFLGFVFNLGALITPLILKGYIDREDMLIYAGCIFWTICYDTFYGFADMSDDISASVKSMSIKMKNKIGYLHIINWLALACFLMGKVSMYDKSTYIGIVLYIILTYWEVRHFNPSDKLSGLLRFKFNLFLGCIISIILL